MRTRREILQLGASGLIAPVMTARAVEQPQPSSTQPIRIAVSTYSFWHFRTPKYPVEQVIEDASRMGFDGVEILHRQMTDESPAYVNKLKQAAFRLGLSLPMLSIHQDFISPKPEERKEAVDHTIKCIDLASRLGIPSIRLNSGRWNTIE
jgi:L-ribulose-5-phosphate 3-epimerase